MKRATLAVCILSSLGAAAQAADAAAARAATDPAEPAFKQVGLCMTGFGVPGASRPFVLGSQVLVNAGEGCPTVFDCSDLRQPKILRHISSWYFTSCIYPLVSRDLTYLSSSRGKLLVLEGLKTMGERGEVKQIEWEPAWGRSFLAGIRPDGLAYTLQGNNILVLDLNDPQKPKLAAKIPQPRLNPGKAASPQLLSFTQDFSLASLVLDGGGRIGLLRWKSPTEPVLCGELPNVGLIGMKPIFGHVLALDNQRLIVAHPASNDRYWRCFKVTFWDIRDPERPRRGADLDFGAATGMHLRDMLLAGNVAYVLDGRSITSGHSVARTQHSRLLVLDVEDAAAPRIVTEFRDDMPTEYSHLSLAGQTLYVNDYNYGLWLFDVSNPRQPVKLGGAPSSAEGHWLYLHGDHAYMAHTFGGTIHVINVADPQRPKTVGYYWDGQWLNYSAKIGGRGDAMYLPQHDGLAIIDISRPAQPKRTGEFLSPDERPLRNPCLAVVDRHAFVTASRDAKNPARLLVYDVSDPLRPRRSAAMEIPAGYGFRVAAAPEQKMLYLVGYGGKRIVAVDVTDVAQPRITADLNAPEIRIGETAYSLAIKDGGGNGSPGGGVAKGHLYVTAGGEAPKEPYVLIFDVRDRSAIRPAGALMVPDRRGWQYFSCDLLVEGNRLYLGDYGCEEAYDITVPAAPKRIAKYRRSYSWQVGALRGKHLYVPKLDALEILEVP